MIVTAGTLEESREALKLAKAHPNLYSTVGVHPTRCSEFFGGGGGDSEAHVAALAAVLEEGKELGKVRQQTMHQVPRNGVHHHRKQIWTGGLAYFCRCSFMFTPHEVMYVHSCQSATARVGAFVGQPFCTLRCVFR